MKKYLAAIGLFLLLCVTPVCLAGQDRIAYASSGEEGVSGEEGQGWWEKGQNIWEKAKDILLDIWENAGVAEEEAEAEGDRVFISQRLKARIFLVVMAVAVALLLLYLVISFLRSSWKEKIHSIVVLILAVAIVAGVVMLGLHLTE